jgi:hypothetical protein
MKMTAGKVFAVLPIAFFWMCFACFAVIALTNPALNQNNMTTLLLMSSTAILFVIILTGTMLLMRQLKNESGFWTSRTNTDLEQATGTNEDQKMRPVPNMDNS